LPDKASAPAPGDKLTLSLVLPGAGTVSIKDVGLYQYASGEDPLQAAGQWFGDRSAGLLGGIGGALIGLWGALIGILASRGWMFDMRKLGEPGISLRTCLALVSQGRCENL